MLARIRKAQEEREGGFTLIELLVVIIIIGILAAIAIPVFLSQRKKGYDASAKSDIRNAATLEETYLTDNGAYAGTAGQNATAALTDFKPSSNVTTLVVSVRGTGGADSFCLSAKHASSGNTWYYDSATGGLKGTTPCT
jgi:type IV pilus assembly protein PilA